MKETKKFEECKTLEEQRCWLAQDVINSIKAKKIIALSGSYLDNMPFITKKDDNKELRDVIKQQEEPCQGCGVGSLFLCAVDAYDKLKVKELVGGMGLNIKGYAGDKIVPYLRQWFSIHQLILIETAFEGNFYGLFMHASLTLKDDQVQAALEFAEKRGANSKKHNARIYERRMVAIMKNIIKNNGTFIP